jgi:hypothetical protein
MGLAASLMRISRRCCGPWDRAFNRRQRWLPKYERPSKQSGVRRALLAAAAGT